MTIDQINLKKQLLDKEQELIKASQAGDQLAQSKLYYRYAKAMLNVAYRIVWNQEDARDILQDAFLKIFNNLKELKDTSTFPAWVKRIVINTAINHQKKNGKWTIVALSDHDMAAVPNNDIDEATLTLTVDRMKRNLLKLPKGYRTVLSLYLIEGYDHKEISSILDISVSTSITQYNRGKQRLKALLSE